MLSVSPLRAMTILPSGGIGPEALASWWDAGARGVGMGTNLAGGDIAFASGVCR
jgi:2-keto-3-deoxy-6-phosphogluconate aldolase